MSVSSNTIGFFQVEMAILTICNRWPQCSTCLCPGPPAHSWLLQVPQTQEFHALPSEVCCYLFKIKCIILYCSIQVQYIKMTSKYQILPWNYATMWFRVPWKQPVSCKLRFVCHQDRSVRSTGWGMLIGDDRRSCSGRVGTKQRTWPGSITGMSKKPEPGQ